MASIVIDIENRSIASSIMEAISLFNGVRKVTIEEDVYYPQLETSIQDIIIHDSEDDGEEYKSYDEVKAVWKKKADRYEGILQL